MTARSWLLLVSLGICALGRPPLAAAADDDDLGEDDEQQAEPAPSEEAAAEGEAAPDDATEAAAPAAGSDADTGPILRARVAVGAGVGTRSVRRPIGPSAEQQVPTAVFPAADVGMAVRLWPEAAFAFDVSLRYRTSIGLTLEERPLFALPNEVDVRSEHVELGVAPSWRLSDAVESARFGIPVGMSLRNFWPTAHQLATPRYTLFGPYVRVELDLPLGSVARLRLAPEAQMFFIVGTDLLDNGVSSPGVALGGEASLQFRLSQRFLLDVSYRQSNALASTTGSASFRDVERFVTAGFSGEM
jgi:hypothetical protein